MVNYNNKKFSQSFFNNKRYTAVRNYTLKWHRSRLYLTSLFFGFLLIGILVPVLAKKKNKTKFENYRNVKSNQSRFHLPSGNVGRVVAPLGLLIVNGTRLATQIAWLNTVQAYVELLAISGMSEFRMSDGLTVLIVLFQSFLLALKSFLGDHCKIVIFSVLYDQYSSFFYYWHR